jgi:thiamine pyrophosphate-dependent acetolactate synthase large subunit-like protein
MPERMPVAVRDAFLQGAPRNAGPVVVGVPFDLQGRPWDGPADLPKPSRDLLPRHSPMPPHPDDVAGAAKLLAGAERVVVLAGLGAVEAGAGAACPRVGREDGRAAVDDASRTRGSSMTIPSASVSRAASRRRWASNT